MQGWGEGEIKDETISLISEVKYEPREKTQGEK